MKSIENFVPANLGKWVVWLLQVVLGGIFLYSGYGKVLTPIRFADSVASFQILPAMLINLFAMSMPWFELFAGMALVGTVCVDKKTIAGAIREVGFLGVILMTSLFTCALVSSLLRGIEVDCGCFGNSKPAIWKTGVAIGRDVIILVISMKLYRIRG